MTPFKLPDGDHLGYVHAQAAEGRPTFVTFNAMTQSLGAWDGVASRWQEHGCGVLRFDVRGQAGSTAAPGVRLDVDRIVRDAAELLDHVQPATPVFVGLSIGGLFAARAVLAGCDAKALVLLNTLRRPGPRLDWINQAVLRATMMGGSELVRDLFAPVLMAEQTLEAMREDAFPADGYRPMDPSSPLARLVRDCVDADWDLPYESLDLPVLVATGLRDTLFLQPEVVDELVLRLPDPHRVNVADAGHLLPAEKPRELADQILDFVSTLPGMFIGEA